MIAAKPLTLKTCSPAKRQAFVRLVDYLTAHGVRPGAAVDCAIDKTLERGEWAPQIIDGDHVSITRGDNIAPEAIRWLWRDWLARGKLHILAGSAGTGKTTLALAMAATVTTGGRWPDGTRSEPRDVMLWSGEDDAADTLVPRLMAMGADVRRVHFVGNVNDARGMRAFDPATDVALLSERFDDCGDVALLIVDPIVSAVAGDSHKNTEVRRSLQPLVDLAALRDTALIGISHYSKGTTGRDPLERVCGSLAFGALARIVLGTAKPTEADQPRRLVRAKSNIGPDGGGFEYDLEQTDVPGCTGLSASCVLWRGAIEGTARDLLAAVETEPDADQGERTDAARWLHDVLVEAGGEMPSRDALKLARGAGFSERTVERARQKAGISVRLSGFGAAKTSVWTLSNKSTAPHTRQNAERESMANMANMADMQHDADHARHKCHTRQEKVLGDLAPMETDAEAYRAASDGE